MSATAQQLARLRGLRTIFLMAGLTLALVGAVLAVRSILFLRSASSVEATVEHVESQPVIDAEGRNRDSYRPTFVFQDAAGQTRTVTLNHFSRDYDFAKGQKVRVLYDPAKANSLRVETFFGVWGATVILLGLGVGLLVLAALLTPAVGKLEAIHRQRQPASA